MRHLVVLLALLFANQGWATALGAQVKQLVGKKPTGPMAIINKINGVDEHGRNALHHAIMLGDLSLVEFFLAHGINTQAIDQDGLSPLRYAEQLAAEQPSAERMKIVSIVLEETRGINKGGAKGWRPMVWSLMAGDYLRVIELRDRGANIFSGRTASGQLAGRHNAVWAAEHLQDDRAIKILAEGAPAEYFPVAVGNGYQRFVQEMIARDVDINTKDRHGYSAAMRAAKAGRVKDLQMLIDHGAQIDSRVLFLAIHSGNPKLVETIVKHDIDLANELITDLIYDKIYFPETFVGDTLAGASKSKKKIQRMIAKAVSKSTLRLPPFETVAKLQQLKEKLRRHNPYLRSKFKTPRLLQVAIDSGTRQDLQKIIDYLIEAKDFVLVFGELLKSRDVRQKSLLEIFVDNNDQWDDYRSIRDLLDILRVAIVTGHTEATQVALDQLNNSGIDINNAVDSFGYTIAMIVAKAGRLDYWQTLIDHGAQIDSRVLFLAIHSGNPKLVETIVKHNVDLASELIADLMYDGIYFPETYVGAALTGKNEIRQIIVKAVSESTLQLPMETVAKLQQLKEGRKRRTPYGNLPVASLLQVAMDAGDRQDLQRIIDHMIEAKKFVPIFGGLLRSSHQFPQNSGVSQKELLDIFVDNNNRWNGYPHHLLDIFRVAVITKHTTAVQIVFDHLDNSDDSVYKELALGLAIANKSKDDDMVKLLLDSAISLGLNKKRLTTHAELLGTLGRIILVGHSKDLETKALLLAMEKNDTETIKKFVELGFKFDHSYYSGIARRLFGNSELLEFLVNSQVISLDEGRGLLYLAAREGDYSAVDKVISLGGKTGIDEALTMVATRTIPNLKSRYHNRDDFEEEVLATMRKLIMADANAKSEEDGRHPLLGAIKSLQAPRVKLLLEQEIVLSGRAIARALRTAALSATQPKYGGENSLADSETNKLKNLTEIKKLLSDKGLL